MKSTREIWKMLSRFFGNTAVAAATLGIISPLFSGKANWPLIVVGIVVIVALLSFASFCALQSEEEET